jgi:hypothetical protein
MPNLTDHNVLEQIRSTHHLHIFSGSGAYEDPNSSGRFARIFTIKRSIMNWIFGDRNGRMTGTHGEQFYHII